MKRAMITTAFTVLALGTAGVALTGPVLARGEQFGQRFIETLDADKDGQVSQEEFLAPRQERFTKADADGDGQLSAEEIQAAIASFREERGPRGDRPMRSGDGPRGPNPEQMIERLDSDGDGLLSAEELAAAPQNQTMFQRLDADGDGAISEEEFQAARDMMRKRGGDRHAGGERHPHWKKY
ncbi:EF-hand domain-containing protein [Actibacterium ureilyticum]|uniref:EF-hand domain-containing protein n=1 Tax=Actibacterium ureilyticum TaxID=1590614 RepID=UPI0015957E6A|nr:EF-hand domain-containing protein [Actibacterium ureilyticum]